jgi:putative tryptophan/tyrosine transport system substrate-binding protein
MKLRCLAILFFLGSASLGDAQQQGRVSRQIGFLAFATPEADRPREKGFLHGLRDLGWIEGQNITIERRYANENHTRVPDIAAELVRLQVDVIVVRDSVAIGPATKATKTIPIVIVVSGDPVRAA